jgi:hypothetical protein
MKLLSRFRLRRFAKDEDGAIFLVSACAGSPRTRTAPLRSNTA